MNIKRTLIMLKAATTTLILGLAICFSANAQSKSLKGPAYKNASPTEKYKGSSTLLVNGKAAKAKGPEAKNQKPWDIDKSEFEVVRLDELKGKNTKGLKGPAYKNYKPEVNN